ncbi:MAG: lytic transglycosylase domain-containing protein [Rhodanobacter sp.]
MACALLAGLLGWSPVRAASLYRCVGSQGETVFASHTAGYHDCKQEASLASAPPRPSALSARTTLSSVLGSVETTAHRIEPPVVSLAWVQGSVETTARPLAAAPLPSDSKPGQWSYQESHGPLQAAGAQADASEPNGSRVLRGAVYRVVHTDGSVEYTNVPQGGTRSRAVTMLFSYIAACVACDLHSTINWGTVPLHLDAYTDTIRAASAEYGVDEAFLRAIIHAESAFNPHALSLKGAQGLMQLMPGTANDMGVLDAFDADDNIRGGARYLALLLKSFNGNERLAAAAYNAGPGAVQHYNGVPPYAETQVYVQRVGELRKRYGQAIHPVLAERGAG